MTVTSKSRGVRRTQQSGRVCRLHISVQIDKGGNGAHVGGLGRRQIAVRKGLPEKEVARQLD